MPFDHERLDVYQLALDFFDLADEIVEHLPRGRGHLADQLTRASLSIVNNIAEGAGKFSKGDKRRYLPGGNGLINRVGRHARRLPPAQAPDD
jgi:hypothetical protein